MSWLRYSVHSSALDHSADGPVPITGLAAADALVHATTQDAGGIAVLTSGGLLRVLVLKAQSEVGGPVHGCEAFLWYTGTVQSWQTHTRTHT